MSEVNKEDLNQEELNPAAAKTPLDQVKEQQALEQENRHQYEQTDNTPEVPGAGPPSDKRHHPQRQMYEGGNASSETI